MITRLNMLLLPWFLFIHFLTSIEKNGFSKSHLRIHWHFIYSSSSACKLFSKSSIFTLLSDHLLYVFVMLVPFVLVLYEHIFGVFSLSQEKDVYSSSSWPVVAVGFWMWNWLPSGKYGATPKTSLWFVTLSKLKNGHKAFLNFTGIYWTQVPPMMLWEWHKIINFHSKLFS